MIRSTSRGARPRLQSGLAAILAAALCGAIPATAAEVAPLVAAGTTAPIQITKSASPVPPGIFVTFAASTTATCTVQATAAEWAPGGLPSTASWQPADPAGSLTNLTATTNAKLGAGATALRLTCSALSAGSVTFGVAQ